MFTRWTQEYNMVSLKFIFFACMYKNCAPRRVLRYIMTGMREYILEVRNWPFGYKLMVGFFFFLGGGGWGWKNLAGTIFKGLLCGGEWTCLGYFVGHWTLWVQSKPNNNFTITADILVAHWLIFIVNKRTDTWIYSLCDVDATNENREFENNQTSICHFF